MDFGSILDEWDAQQKKSSKKSTTDNSVNSNKTPSRSGLSLKCNAGDKKTRDVTTNTVSNSSKNSLQNSTGSQKSTIAPTKKVELPKANPMDIWLRRYGVTDKDAVEDEIRRKEKLEDRDYLRTMRPEARIDLHGLTRDEAWLRLEQFISECVRRGLKKVLIVHGKGNHSVEAPVLDIMVRSFIEKDKRLGASGHPDKTMGGKGATWVIIRQNEYQQ